MGQTLLVAAIVAAAFAWVVWSLLLPAATRNRLRRLAGRPAAPASGCGGGGGGGACSGCCGGSDEPPRAHH